MSLTRVSSMILSVVCLIGVVGGKALWTPQPENQFTPIKQYEHQNLVLQVQVDKSQLTIGSWIYYASEEGQDNIEIADIMQDFIVYHNKAGFSATVLDDLSLSMVNVLLNYTGFYVCHMVLTNNKYVTYGWNVTILPMSAGPTSKPFLLTTPKPVASTPFVTEDVSSIVPTTQPETLYSPTISVTFLEHCRFELQCSPSFADIEKNISYTWSWSNQSSEGARINVSLQAEREHYFTCMLSSSGQSVQKTANVACYNVSVMEGRQVLLQPRKWPGKVIDATYTRCLRGHACKEYASSRTGEGTYYTETSFARIHSDFSALLTDLVSGDSGEYNIELIQSDGTVGKNWAVEVEEKLREPETTVTVAATSLGCEARLQCEMNSKNTLDGSIIYWDIRNQTVTGGEYLVNMSFGAYETFLCFIENGRQSAETVAEALCLEQAAYHHGRSHVPVYIVLAIATLMAVCGVIYYVLKRKNPLPPAAEQAPML
ncbi:hypothetical protein [Equine adenovirus 2]|uniref:Ig-like domain-containing protein n=1 Tax=Equine adenovirus B serotype 2 TaxID=67603 RepID=A0A0K1DCQ5_ADEE2|nr:hypothetical protein [Equine adenovirus 2]AKT26014.1 hypothetical protein [Equine adenovirus 2]